MFRLARVVSSRAVCRTSVRAYSQNVAGGATIDKRERTLEDKNVRDHEKALLEDLVKQLDVRRRPFTTPLALHKIIYILNFLFDALADRVWLSWAGDRLENPLLLLLFPFPLFSFFSFFFPLTPCPRLLWSIAQAACAAWGLIHEPVLIGLIPSAPSP